MVSPTSANLLLIVLFSPLPKTIKKRSLNQKERLIYAPLTGHGGMLYDKDAVYLDTEVRQDEEREGDNLLEEMKNPELAEQEENVGLTLIRGGEAIERRVVPEKIENEVDEDEEMDEDDESDEELEGPEDVASASEDEEEMEIDEEDENQIRELQREIEGMISTFMMKALLLEITFSQKE